MGNAEPFGDAAGVFDILTGAAGAGPVGGRAMIVELQRHADDIVALALQKTGDDGGIHASGHGDDDARLLGSSRQIEAVGHCCSVPASGVRGARRPPQLPSSKTSI